MLTRRDLMIPALTGAFAASFQPHHALAAAEHKAATETPLPSRYDTPLGIGLETWAYPAPVRWHMLTEHGQPLRMAYMDVPPAGPSRGATIVLMHGKSFDSSYWAGQIRAFTKAGYRVIVPDQLGFNKSSKPDFDYSFEMLAEHTLNLLGGLQLGKVHLLGHSTGGMLAVRIAAAYPDRVDRLVLEDPIGLVDYRRFVPPIATDTLVAEQRRHTATSYRAFIRHFFVTLPPAATECFVEWRMRVALSGEYERFCKAAALTYQMIYREPVRDEYADIRATTLIVAGERDTTAPLKHYAAPDVAAKIPTVPAAAADAVKDLRKGSLSIVPGVGHIPHLEAPDVFAKTVIDFLAS